MIDTVFGIKVRMSGLCINRYRPIIGRLLDADYRPADNRSLPYRCISSYNMCILLLLLVQESPAVADKPARRKSMPKLLQFDVRAYNVVADNTGLSSFV